MKNVRQMSTLLASFFIFTFSALHLTSANSGFFYQGTAPQLELGKSIEHKVAGVETHSVSLAMKTGQFARVVVTQQEIDILIRLLDGNSQELASVDNSQNGDDVLFWVAQSSGTFRIEVRAFDSTNSGNNSFRIRLTELRTATPDDGKRIEAQRRMSVGSQFREQSEKGTYRRAIDEFDASLNLWLEVGEIQQAAHSELLIGWTLSEWEENTEAQKRLEQARRRYEEIKDQTGTAMTLNSIGLAYKALEEKQKALETYNRALSAHRAAGYRRGEADAFGYIANIYIDLGEKKKAIEYLEQSLSLFRSVGHQGSEAKTLQQIGDVYNELGEKPTARRYYEESIALRRKIGNKSDEARTLHNIGYKWSELGERQIALEHYERALTLRKAIGDRAGEALTLHQIGYTWSESGEKKKALEYYEQAHTLYQAVGDRRSDATTLHNMGLIWSELGENQKALEYYEQALALRRMVGDRKSEATSLHSIAFCLSELGERRKALDYYEQALTLRRAVGDRSGEVTTLHNMAANWFELGENQKASEYYEQALTLGKALEDRGVEARILHQMGSVFAGLRENRKAADYYERALPLWRTAKDQYGEAFTLTALGRVCTTLRERQKALEYYTQALPLWQAIGNKGKEALTLSDLGLLYTILGEKQKALSYYELALLLYRAVADRDEEMSTLREIGELYDGLGEKGKSLDYYRQALILSRGDDAKTLNLLNTVAEISESLGEAQKTQEYRNEIQSIQTALTLRLWNPGTRQSLPVRFAGQRDVTAVVYSPNGKVIASASSDKIVRIWDSQTGHLIREFKGHGQSVETLAFSLDGNRLYSGSWDKTVRIWEVSTGRSLQILTGYDGAVKSIALSPDGKRLASAGADRVIRIIDATDGKNVLLLKGHAATINSIAFSPDGRRLISGSDDGKILLWNVEKGTALRTFTGHEGEVNTVAFSPDGRSLASGGDDQTVRKWNLDDASDNTGKVIYRHAAPVSSVVFRPDGKYIASGSHDKTVRLSNGSESLQIVDSALKVTGISYTTNGTVLATAGQVESPPTLHLLLIGIGQYKDNSIYPLAGPQNDVQGIKDVLETRSGFSRINTRVLLNDNATRADILNALEEIGRTSSPQDTAIIYYGGHGDQAGSENNKTFTLPPFDYDRSRIETGISTRLLQTSLAKIEAKQKFVVLDAAYSSLGLNALSAGYTKESREFGELFQQNVAILSQDGVGPEIRGADGKYFGQLSFALIEGVNGKADTNNDGIVTAREASRHVVVETNKRAPSLRTNEIQIGNDFSIASVPQRAAPEQRKSTVDEGNQLQFRSNPIRHVGKSYVGELLTAFAPGFASAFHYTADLLFPFDYFQQTQEPQRPLPPPPGQRQRGESDIVGELRQSPDQGLLRKGKDFALFLATDSYKKWKKLENPIRDAETIAQELKDYYGFEIDSTSDIVRNPEKADIIKALIRFKKKAYSDNDQLFIFIAGHGHFIEDQKEGFIVAGNSESPAADEVGDSYLSHTQLRKLIDTIPCKHIFLVIDACFSGTFDEQIARRGNDPDYAEADNYAFISRKLAFRTRRYLTSGGKEYVSDGRAGQHSPFARKFIEALRTYGGKYGVLTISGVLAHVERVIPEPMRGEFGGNEPGSDFVFMIKNKPKQ